jgi:hypothetical protein
MWQIKAMDFCARRGLAGRAKTTAIAMLSRGFATMYGGSAPPQKDALLCHISYQLTH